MIGFDSNETAYTEGFIKDALKSTANVDTDEVVKDWKAMKQNNGAADAIGKFNKVANDDILKNAADRVDDAAKTIKKHTSDRRSIIARAKNSVLYFPVYITQTIRVNEAHIIAGLFERVYATLMQTILSQNPIISEKEANDLLFLKKFHTNINESADLVLYNEFYTPIDDIDTMMKESVFYREQITPTIEVTFRAIPCDDPHIILEHGRTQHDHLAKLSYLHEDANDKKDEISEKNTKRDYLSEKDLEDMAMDKAGLSNSEKKAINTSVENIRKDVKASNPGASDNNINAEVNRRLKQKEAAEKKLDASLKELKDNIKSDKLKGYHYDGGKFYRSDVTTKVTTRPASEKSPDVIKGTDAPKLLRDADIKKINGMLPWTIEASFRIKGENGALDKDVHYIIGVKTNLHLIRAQDLSEDLREIINGNMKRLQKVRYKTGEITFADYMFNKKGIKADAAKSVNYNKRWLNTLKRLAEWDKTNGTLLDTPAKLINGSSSIPIPNGTIVLSQTDVTTMMNETGIDLSMANNAARLAKALFLIAVCIVDSSAGTMRVLFPDSSSDWDVQSLGAIDAELSKSDNSKLASELNRMINRVN